MGIKERIGQYLKFKSLSATKAESMLNWGKGTLTKSSSLTSGKLEEFLLLFTDLSAEWLMRGVGEMIVSDESADTTTSIKISGQFEVDDKGYLRVKIL